MTLDPPALQILLALGFVSTLAVGGAGLARPQLSGWVALGGAMLLLLAFASAVRGEPEPLDIAWIPHWNVRAHLALDGLAIAYGALTLWVAVIVLAYAPRYMEHHVESTRQSMRALVPFFLLFSLFVATMLGLVLSLDLLLFFLFWDVTAICSYLLIGFDRHDETARRSALMALLVTGISSILLLAAVVLLQIRYGTTDLTQVAGAASDDPMTTAACLLLIAAALGKSAQWPLHFWLPRAMAAPTPVSAYLHAAAMVAAGVFLLQRVQRLLEAIGIGDLLAILGWFSMVAGGILALRENHMKRLLAYSTVAQYGHVVFLVGLGGAHGAAAAAFFVVAHGICKSALFLTAGAVTFATGKHELSDVGGLFRRLPALGITSAVAAAGLAGVPLTVGFFKDEVLFATAAEHGWHMVALAVTGPLLTITYMWKFWSRIFLGLPQGTDVHLPASIVAPIGISSVVVLLLGIVPRPLGRIAEQAAIDIGEAHLSLAYHFDARPSNIAAAIAFAGAVLLTLLRVHKSQLLQSVSRVPGPEQAYLATGRMLARGGHRVRKWAPQALRARVSMVFVATLALVVTGQAALGVTLPGFDWRGSDVPAAAAAIAVGVAAIATVTQRRHLRALFALSLTTLILALLFALLGAPDVALVLVVINVVTSLLLVALLVRLPRGATEEQVGRTPLRRWRGEDELLAGGAGVLAFLVAAATLGSQEPATAIGERLFHLADAAHAKNAVAAILVDFRGLDTLGEITVVAVSVLAVATFMERRRGQE